MADRAVEDILAQLEALGDERMRAQNRKNGAGDNQFGVRLGEIRKVAARVKCDHDTAMALWQSGNVEGRLLAALSFKPKALSMAELDRLVRSVSFVQEADWLTAYVVKKHPDKETLRRGWMEDADCWAARAGWSLTAERIDKAPEGLDLAGLLDRIEAEMGDAAPEAKWTMNFCLAGIGINFPEHRARALAIGEALGAYRDYPVPKGCTSPFAPLWIAEMVRRGEAG
ncbi:DNA alkylation repair protein [Pelagibacterium lacus]|uniref:DNA alkylation repair protein n=1 Tax=Pelagibacterium lacus TaxID=2282655 RepID=A0A369W8C3_9HYPH|nr:DNA alkylation repair protein [Pelagibacterium lacus]RDE10297.1 DNA alkylation repair protein [Pelagibacterium lacus]